VEHEIDHETCNCIKKEKSIKRLIIAHDTQQTKKKQETATLVDDPVIEPWTASVIRILRCLKTIHEFCRYHSVVEY
jgi:hypothetical protein